MSFLQAQLDSLINPDPLDFDGDDNDDTVARVIDKSEGNWKDDDFRTNPALKASQTQNDLEKRYSGTEVKLGENDSGPDDLEDVEVRSYSSIEDDLEDGSEEGEGSDDLDSNKMVEESDDEIQLYSDGSSMNKKATALKLQLSMIDSLLTCRIKMQKLLVEDPDIYQGQNFKEFSEKFDKIETYYASLNLNLASTITSVHERTKLYSKFSKFETSPIDQINSILQPTERDRLMKRTQRKRTLHDISDSETTNPECFDDTDFYQDLLKQIVNTNLGVTIDATDTTEITRRWLKLQEKRKKVRSRQVTTYHTRKAKKLSFEIHKKMINFAAPDQAEAFSYTHEARNTLFSSLFQ